MYCSFLYYWVRCVVKDFGVLFVRFLVGLVSVSVYFRPHGPILHSFLNFLEGFVENCCYFSLKRLVEFTSAATRVWSFRCGKAFNCKLNLLNRRERITGYRLLPETALVVHVSRECFLHLS